MTPGLPFAAGFVALAAAAAGLAGFAPVGFSLVAVGLLAGPHNWLEARYVLGRLPARAGQLWPFFALSAAGVVGLTAGFAALPWLLAGSPGETVAAAYAGWDGALLGWAAGLVWLRSRTNPRFDGRWVPGAACLLIAGALVAPGAPPVALVYLHPLMALAVLDRELTRSRRAWRPAYRAALLVVPGLLLGLWWHLAAAPDLPGDDPLTRALVRHAGGSGWGASTHFLVAAHAFLEAVHYAAWVVLIPLVGVRGRPWAVAGVPAARRGPRWAAGVTAVLAAGAGLVLVLWLGFLADFATTRAVYFTAAMLHVLAEVPFLLRMLSVPPADFLRQMAVGYLLTVAIETAVLWGGLSGRHPGWVRLFAGAWLSACTYPVVWLALPPLFADRATYLLAAEGFAAAAEVGLFWMAFARGRLPDRRATARDAAAVVGANLLSFAAGEGLAAAGDW